MFTNKSNIFSTLKKTIPRSLFIVLLIQLKIFPLFVFSYFKIKHNVIITDPLLKAIREKKINLKYMKKRQSTTHTEFKEDILILTNLDLPFFHAVAQDQNLK
jgi:hypothetical protein